MTKSILTTIALMFVVTISKAQTTGMQFSGKDCNGNSVDLFADLDAGKIVILHFFMPSCGSCPPPAQKIQTMANNINNKYPGKVKGYAFPFQNSTTCSYAANWVSSNNLGTLYTAMDSGAAQVAYYGGFGMPTVVVLGGTDHKVLFSTLSFSTNDTTEMRDKILAKITGTAKIESTKPLPSFTIFPNPSNGIISIQFDNKEISNLQIDIIDITGKKVGTIANETQIGSASKLYNASLLSKGIYYIRFQANDKISTQKLIIN